MTDIIEKWLLNSIGVNISLSSSVLGEACFDGTLYAKILHKYSVCNHAYVKNIKKTSQYKDAYVNLKKLCVWFKLLGISYNDQLLKEIASKQSSSALRLLYELFTKLESRETLRFVDARKKERLLTESTDKFFVTRAPEPKPEKYTDDEKKYLYDYVEKGQELINTFLEKEKKFIDDCRKDCIKRRKALKENLEKDELHLKMETHFSSPKQARDANYFNVIDEYERLLHKKERKEELKHIVTTDNKELVSRLKSHRQRSEKNMHLREKMIQETLSEAWKELLTTEESKAKDSIANILLKQSEHEKQMLLRLKRSRSRYKKFIENRKLILLTEQKQKSASDFKESFRILRDEDANKIENERIQELHNKLLSEKNNLRSERDYRVCRSIFYDLVDYAIVLQEFKNEFKEEPSKQKLVGWKILFIKGLPIFECIAREAMSLKEGTLSQNGCSETLADYEFHLYNCLLGPWDPLQYPALSEVNLERLDRIGYVIHRLLDMKYKYEMSFSPPAQVKKYNIQVLLRSVKNLYIVSKLKHFLRKAKIAVIDVNTAINYVINAYNKYVINHNLQKDLSSFRKKINTLNIQIPDVLVRNREEKKALLLEKIAVKKPVNESKYHNISIQFPSSIEITSDTDTEIPRSVVLGRIVQCYLCEGLLLSDVLTSQIILEYIKNLNNINGWVLINFPYNLKQAAVLEYTFSGLEIPFKKYIADQVWLQFKREFVVIEDEISLINFTNTATNDKENIESINFSKSTQICMSKEENDRTHSIPIVYVDSVESVPPCHILDKELDKKLKCTTLSDIFFAKRSDILPKPNPDRPLPPFTSIFTKVIPVKTCSNEKYTEEAENEEAERNEFELEDEWAELAKLDGLFSSETVDNFYRELNILVPFSYKDLKPDILMDLGRIILNKPVNEGDFMWTNSVDVFGFDMLCQMKPKRFLHEANSCVDQTENIKTDLFGEFTYHRPSLERLTKLLFESLDNQVKKTIADSEGKNDPEHHFKSSLSTDQNIPNEYYELLASLWETTEFFYVNNVSDVFNFLRLIDSQLYPYKKFVLKRAEQCTSLSDDRKLIVSNFQVMLNSIRADLRQVKSMKNELHCRVNELQHSLWKLSDIKKLFSEEILQSIKKENWLHKRLCSYLKGYSLALQAEADRFVNTLQILTDYYSVSITGQPSGKKIGKILLPVFDWDRDHENDSKKSMKHVLKSQISHKRLAVPSKYNSYPKNNLSSNLEESVIYCAESMEKNTLQSLELLTNQVDSLKTQINQIREFCKIIVEDTHDKRVSLKDPRMSLLRSSRTSTQKQKVLLERNDSFFSEWDSALDDETNRMIFRLSLIHATALANMQHQISAIESVFKEFGLSVLDQYHKERLNIDRLCDLFRAAIEEEVKIQPSIVLDQDKFYLDPDNLMYPSPPPPPPTPLEELSIGNKFTIYQLHNFLNKMSYTAPLGIIKGAFVYIIQDMACFGHELGNPYLPRIWFSFGTDTIFDLVDRWFGNRSIICWKEFIIFALDLEYPSLAMVLNMKEQFEIYDPEHSELITKHQFTNSVLWFEQQEVLGIEETLRCSKIKNLLFNLFQVNEDKMNYTCFLLYLCKGEFCYEGFIKALAVVNGFITVPWKSKAVSHEKYIDMNYILQDILNSVYKTDKVIEEVDFDEEPNLYDFLPDNDSGPQVSDSHESQNCESDIDINNSKGPEEHKIHSNQSIKKLDWQEYLTNFMPISKFLEFDVHFDTVLSLLVFYLQYYSVHPNHGEQQLSLEKRLNIIFLEKGDGYTVNLGILLDDCFVKDLFSSYRLFQEIKITTSLNMQEKEFSVVAQEYLFQL